MFSAAQLRVFLRALVNIDPYTFDDVAEQLTANDESNQQTSEEILLSTIDGLPDDKLTGFALRLVFTGHTPIPRESEIDFRNRSRSRVCSPTTQEEGQQDGEGTHTDQGHSKERSEEEDG